MVKTIALGDWMKRLPVSFSLSDAIPHLHSGHAFPWDFLSSLFSERFDLPHLSVKPSHTQWKVGLDAREGLGEDPYILGFDIAPFPGNAFWMMSKEDMKKWVSWLWKREPFLGAESLQEGFYRYTILRVLSTLQEIDTFQEVTPIFNEHVRFPEEKALVIDMEIHNSSSSAWGRLVLSSELVRSFTAKRNAPPRFLSVERATSISLIAPIIAETLSFTLPELKAIKKGDFLPFDNPFRSEKGFLCLGKTPFFQVRIAENKIHLVNYAVYYQEKNLMEQKIPSPILADKEASAALKEVPMPLTIELARLRITLEQLIQLAPGSVLDLPIHPEQNVILSINGQKVGTAELVTIGDTAGIRILELG